MTQIHIVGKNIEVTPALRAHADEKMQSLQKRYDHINSINVILHVEKDDQIADATLHLNGIELHATASSTDMYHSIDAMTEKLLAQLIKHKEKVIESHRS